MFIIIYLRLCMPGLEWRKCSGRKRLLCMRKKTWFSAESVRKTFKSFLSLLNGPMGVSPARDYPYSRTGLDWNGQMEFLQLAASHTLEMCIIIIYVWGTFSGMDRWSTLQQGNSHTPKNQTGMDRWQSCNWQLPKLQEEESLLCLSKWYRRRWLRPKSLNWM